MQVLTYTNLVLCVVCADVEIDDFVDVAAILAQENVAVVTEQQQACTNDDVAVQVAPNEDRSSREHSSITVTADTHTDAAAAISTRIKKEPKDVRIYL